VTERLNAKRLMIYSHDTFGLGHLRRCRAIAHSLVERFKGLTILILSGSPIIADFDFRARVDFIRIPGVIKLFNGEYTSLRLKIDLKDTLSIRESIIRNTTREFAPDLFLVDKEPLGLKGEMTDTLRMLKGTGTKTILGLRDIMDEPTLLKREWAGRDMLSAMYDLYDDIWIYGLEEFFNPLTTMDVTPALRDKIIYTGYLPRSLPKKHRPSEKLDMEEPYILVTPGGGGDGATMVDWVMRAFEGDDAPPFGALMVLGPFMPPELRAEFMDRAAKLARVKVISFDSRMEVLMANSVGVISMGGYNTFCEILSYDKRALVIPRMEPRKEQLYRTTRAEELGLSKMLIPDGDLDTRTMVEALRNLPDQNKPSESLLPGMLDGLDRIGALVRSSVEDEGGIQRPLRALWS
jgi:predicted glycosyltransferase